MPRFVGADVVSTDGLDPASRIAVSVQIDAGMEWNSPSSRGEQPLADLIEEKPPRDPEGTPLAQGESMFIARRRQRAAAGAVKSPRCCAGGDSTWAPKVDPHSPRPRRGS